jgi:hypothetical protein
MIHDTMSAAMSILVVMLIPGYAGIGKHYYFFKVG